MDLTPSWPSEFEFSYVSDIEYMVTTLLKAGFHDFMFYKVQPAGKLRLIAHSYAYDTHQRTKTMLWLLEQTPLSVKLYPANKDTMTYMEIDQKINERDLELNNNVCQLCMPSDPSILQAIQAFHRYIRSVFQSTNSFIYDVLSDLIVDYVPVHNIYKTIERAQPLTR